MKKSSMLKYGIALLFLCVCNTSYAEDTFTVNGITYKLATTSTVVIVKMDVPSDGHVVFPSSIEYRDRTFTVTGIGIGGDCVFNNPEALESMVIPATIKGFGCSGSGLERYYSYIFDKCVNLKKLLLKILKKTCIFILINQIVKRRSDVLLLPIRGGLYRKKCIIYYRKGKWLWGLLLFSI